MVRQRPMLGTPFGTDGPWLAAILDVLGDLHDLLDARFPEPAERSSGGPVPISEPAPDLPHTTPVSEPAPKAVPLAEDPDEVEEPAPDEVPDLPEPPPRAGRGSGLDAWRAFADAAEVAYPVDARRDDVIAACEAAGVIPVEQ